MFRQQIRLSLFAVLAAFTLALTGCGGGGGGGDDPPMMPEPTAQERCEAGGGRYNADGSCTSAEDLAAEAEAKAISDAIAAAKVAYDAAKAAFAAIENDRSVDVDSYVRAQIAMENAKAAYDAAMAAETSEAARAAQMDAEAAQADTEKYAGMIADAKAAAVEMTALEAERGKAMDAHVAAQTALAGVTEDENLPDYVKAKAAADAAKAAYDAAKAAGTSTMAMQYRMAAEAALADVQMYVALVSRIEDARAAAQGALDAAKAALAGVEEIKDSDLASHTRAADAVADAEAANEMAKAATTADAAEAAQGDAEDARDNAVKYAGMVTAAKAKADAEANAAAMKEAANKMAMTKEDAIKAEAGGEAAVLIRPFDSTTAFDVNTATSNYGISIDHKNGAASVTITDPGMNLSGDPKFEMMNGKHVRTVGSETETIVVHTDIEAPVATAFGRVHALTAGDDPDTTVTDNTRIEGTYISANLAHVDLGIATPAKGGTTDVEFAQDDANTLTTNEGNHRGRFDGAMGTYNCASADCEATVNDEGVTTTLVGTWTFTPDAGVTVDVDDDDYLHYGFWVKSSVTDGVMSYDAVQTFAGSSLDANTDVSSVTGTATYEGNAADVYTHDTIDDVGDVDVVGAGTFTADVSLTANFGGTSVAEDDQNTVSGEVTNFMLSGGQTNNWKLSLSDGAIAAGVITGTGWSGQFHGTGSATDATVAPPVVVGEFNGTFVNGEVAGAYGARKQP